MKRRWSTLVVLAVLAGLIGCRRAQEAASPEDAATQPAALSTKVLPPAVAGGFYPADAETLGKEVDRLLAEAKPAPIERLRALICPHAGYPYSGQIAASGYKQLEGRGFRTVIVMGPSHTAQFDGAALADAGAVETPLGKIPISAKMIDLRKAEPFVVDPECKVVRRGGFQYASKELPPFGQETPYTFEHSVEVQIPFLQRTLKDFEVVPVVLGEVDPEEVARSLLPVLDNETLLVASSDLTHYLPYDTARMLDSISLQAICSGSPDWFEEEDEVCGGHGFLACGKGPILALMHVARQKGWKARLLDYRNSGDTTDERRRVVGYAAIAFYEPSAAEAKISPVGAKTEYSPASRKLLLELARKSVTAAAKGEDPPSPDGKDIPASLAQSRACFVTLTKGGQLRGCIGSVFPREPLYLAVVHAARSAASEDRRFPPVRPEELKDVHIEVSVLTLPERLKFDSPEQLLAKLRPGIDGVVLRVGSKHGLFLPQVWEQLPDKRDFLNRLAAEKAGLVASAWQRSDAKVLVYQVLAFQESK